MSTNTKKVSLYSAASIGSSEQLHSYRNDHIRKQYQEEAKTISEYMKNVHYSQKLSAMQVNYSNTVQKLSEALQTKQNNNQIEAPVPMNHYLRPSTTSTTAKDPFKIQREQEFREFMKKKVIDERHINERKRLYYNEQSRKSIADEIVKGKAPMPKQVIFPQKVSHEQILAMTGGRISLDPNILPPETIKPKKWLGDGVGWEK